MARDEGTGAELPRDPEGLRERLQARLGPEPDDREASGLSVSGVVVPIVPGPAGPLALLIRRSEDLSAHPGQISYPGGRREPGETPRRAAVRELREETGLGRDAVEVVGHVGDHQTHYDDLVCAYAGLVESPARRAEPTTPEEVTERLLVPLQGLLEGRAAAPRLEEPLLAADERALGVPYPVLDYEARVLRDAGAPETVHYWHLAEDTALWGISAALTARLLERAFAWRPPAKPREVDEPGDLQP